MALRAASFRLVACCASTWAESSCTRSQPPLPNHRGFWISAISSTNARPSHRMGSGPIQLVEGIGSGIAGRVAEVFLDAQQLVVLGEPVRARQRSGLDLQRVRADRQVGNESVFGFAGAVRDHRGIARAL